jgi:hypothetical protein
MLAAACVLPIRPAAARPRQADPMWPHRVVVPPRSPKHKPQPRGLWLPDDAQEVRGLVCAFGGRAAPLDTMLVQLPAMRETLTDLRLGALNFIPSLVTEDPWLATLAELSKHPELTRVPILTVGYGSGGIGARNAAYLAPERVIAVLHLKSGNLQANIPDVTRSLAGVPMLSISGEFEECGPAGGDLGIGLRREYAVDPTKASTHNQTQWVMLRMQLLERRRRNPENLLSLVVDRGGSHGSWDKDLTRICTQFIRSTAALRLPAEVPPGEGVIHCRPVKAADGWLSDADIKHFTALPAPFAAYKGDPLLAFWYPDFEMAECVFNYHGRGWNTRDPTFGRPAAERYAPPPRLSDRVELPPPPPLHWKGGAGTWARTAPGWLDARRPAPWNPACRAVIARAGSRLAVTNNMACSGLELGPECVLDLGTSRLDVRWSALLDAQSMCRVRIDKHQRPDRYARLSIAGRARLGGRLVVEADPESTIYGVYRIVSAGAPVEGAFEQIVGPEGWKLAVTPTGVTVEHAAPPRKQRPSESAPPPPPPPPVALEVPTLQGELENDLEFDLEGD